LSTTHKLLLVEDEPTLRFTLEAILDFGGYQRDSVESAREALERLKTHSYAGVILDLGLPDIDGAQLIRTIREQSEIPILVVSGRADEKISVLDLGADDFVSKPFLPDELLARIRAILRRHKANAVPIIGMSALNVEETDDPNLREGTLEAKLFNYLLERVNELVPTEELLFALWGETGDAAQNHLRVLLAKLRVRLKAEGQRLLIVNEWGKGYRLTRVAEVAEK